MAKKYSPTQPDMKKQVHLLMMIIASSLLLIGQLNAQTILCVDRDFGDDTSTTYTNTWPMISEALDAAGYTYDYWEVLDPADNGPDADVMSDYDVVIWFTGEAWTGGETMGPEDEYNLTLYMSLGGGKLFLNAQDWLYDKYFGIEDFSSGEFPYDQLGLRRVIQDVYHIEEDPDTARFAGAAGSLAEGLEFPVQDIFTTPTDDGLYGDSIADHIGQALMTVLVPYVSPGPPAIQYENEYWRAVFTTIDIAAITDITARNILMHRIVDWLMYGTTGIIDTQTDYAELLIRPNPVTEVVEIGMTGNMREVAIYNSQGQLVRFEKVNQTSVKMDLGDLGSGIYIVKVRTDKGIVTDKLLVQ
jgi:hypothetical protein